MPYDLVCLSHLRWDFVYQRPQHLLSRFARGRRVFFIEEPTFDAQAPRLDASTRPDGVTVCVPRLPDSLTEEEIEAEQKRLLSQLFAEELIKDFVFWYYTPMALAFTHHLEAAAPSCTTAWMSCRLSHGASAGAALHGKPSCSAQADLVFTGGQSLYECEASTEHPNVHAFPSSVDVPHFAQARMPAAGSGGSSGDPASSAGLLRRDRRAHGSRAARERGRRCGPIWQLVLIGPVVKIDPRRLPQPAQHSLPGRPRATRSCRAIWPAGTWRLALRAQRGHALHQSRPRRPSIWPRASRLSRPRSATWSRPYGERGLVRIADTPNEFVAAVDAAMARTAPHRLKRVDAFLARTRPGTAPGPDGHLVVRRVIKARPASGARGSVSR